MDDRIDYTDSLRLAVLAEVDVPARIHKGSLAITLISNWYPYSHVTPTPVSVGCGASPQNSGTTFQIVSNLDSGSTINTVTSITSSKVQPAAPRIAFRLLNARRT